MFTGVIRHTGKIVQRSGNRMKFRITDKKLLDSLSQGDSLAVNGVCLTVEETSGDIITSFVSEETLRVTTLGFLPPGSTVNLEPPLSLQDLLHGHIVQGHVDGVGIIEDLFIRPGQTVLRIRYPAELDRYIVAKGSVAVDGISLTVVSLNKGYLEASVIPETLQGTHLKEKHSGDKVNLEVDILARYAEKALKTFP